MLERLKDTINSTERRVYRIIYEDSCLHCHYRYPKGENRVLTEIEELLQKLSIRPAEFERRVNCFPNHRRLSFAEKSLHDCLKGHDVFYHIRELIISAEIEHFGRRLQQIFGQNLNSCSCHHTKSVGSCEGWVSVYTELKERVDIEPTIIATKISDTLRPYEQNTIINFLCVSTYGLPCFPIRTVLQVVKEIVEKELQSPK